MLVASPTMDVNKNTIETQLEKRWTLEKKQ